MFIVTEYAALSEQGNRNFLQLWPKLYSIEQVKIG